MRKATLNARGYVELGRREGGRRFAIWLADDEYDRLKELAIFHELAISEQARRYIVAMLGMPRKVPTK